MWNKGNKIISFAELKDVDVSDKVDGHVPTYNSILDKLILEALPESSGGSGATSLDGLNDVDLSTVGPVSGDALLYDGTKWVPSKVSSTGTASGTTYVIDLVEWGITAGIPSKPYTNAHYTTANNNITGLNNAIQFAAANGYTDIVLPRGEYSICYPNSINMVSYMTFNFNGATLKVIYDSDTKSPYDTADRSTLLDYYNFGGFSIRMTNTIHSHIKNLVLIGCRYDRSFANAAEEAMESSYGIILGDSTRYSSVRHCDISYYMGDNITFSSGIIGPRWSEFGLGLTANSVDYGTGQLTASVNNTATTQLFTLPAGDYDKWFIQGRGYARATGLYNRHQFDVFYYDASNNYIGVLPKRHPYSQIDVPPNASKFRVMFYNESNIARDPSINFCFGEVNHHNLLEFNELHDSHRGGITPAGNHNTIQHNVIRHNGKYTNDFLDNKKHFNDPTMYGINQEDGYGEGTVIRGNHIYGSFHGILIGCYSVTIENNHIYDCDYLAINVYTMNYGLIRGNFIANCLYSLGIAGNGFGDAYVLVTQNHFYNGMLDIGWAATPEHHWEIVDNNFYNPKGLFDVGVHRFRGNRIKLYLDQPTQHDPALETFYDYSTQEPLKLRINKMEDCLIEGRINGVFPARSNAIFLTNKMVGCTLKNLNASFTTQTDATKDSEVVLKDCEVHNTIFTNKVDNTKSRHVKLIESLLKDSPIQIANATIATSVAKTSLTDCDIISTNLDSLVITDLPFTTGSVEMKDCRIEINNSTLINLIKHLQTAVASDFKASMKNTDLTYTGGTPLTMAYYNNSVPMDTFISSNNRLNNITKPSEEAGIFIGYDTDKQYKETATTTLNVDQYEATVTHNLNTLEPYVFCTDVNSDVIYPTIRIVDANTVLIKHSEAGNIKVSVTKMAI